jgi:hypothetical protein
MIIFKVFSKPWLEKTEEIQEKLQDSQSLR